MSGEDDVRDGKLDPISVKMVCLFANYFIKRTDAFATLLDPRKMLNPMYSKLRNAQAKSQVDDVAKVIEIVRIINRHAQNTNVQLMIISDVEDPELAFKLYENYTRLRKWKEEMNVCTPQQKQGETPAAARPSVPQVAPLILAEEDVFVSPAEEPAVQRALPTPAVLLSAVPKPAGRKTDSFIMSQIGCAYGAPSSVTDTNYMWQSMKVQRRAVSPARTSATNRKMSFKTFIEPPTFTSAFRMSLLPAYASVYDVFVRSSFKTSAVRDLKKLIRCPDGVLLYLANQGLSINTVLSETLRRDWIKSEENAKSKLPTVETIREYMSKPELLSKLITDDMRTKAGVLTKTQLTKRWKTNMSEEERKHILTTLNTKASRVIDDVYNLDAWKVSGRAMDVAEEVYTSMWKEQERDEMQKWSQKWIVKKDRLRDNDSDEEGEAEEASSLFIDAVEYAKDKDNVMYPPNVLRLLIDNYTFLTKALKMPDTVVGSGRQWFTNYIATTRSGQTLPVDLMEQQLCVRKLDYDCFTPLLYNNVELMLSNGDLQKIEDAIVEPQIQTFFSSLSDAESKDDSDQETKEIEFVEWMYNTLLNNDFVRAKTSTTPDVSYEELKAVAARMKRKPQKTMDAKVQKLADWYEKLQHILQSRFVNSDSKSKYKLKPVKSVSIVKLSLWIRDYSRDELETVKTSVLQNLPNVTDEETYNKFMDDLNNEMFVELSGESVLTNVISARKMEISLCATSTFDIKIQAAPNAIARVIGDESFTLPIAALVREIRLQNGVAQAEQEDVVFEKANAHESTDKLAVIEYHERDSKKDDALSGYVIVSSTHMEYNLTPYVPPIDPMSWQTVCVPIA